MESNENTQERRAIPYSDFEMTSVKYAPKTGVVVAYLDKSTGRHQNPSDDKNKPHPDFHAALKALAPHVVHILGLQRGYDLAREELRDNDEALNKAVKGAKDADGSFTVSGIRFAGEGKNASVKITGSLKCLTGAVGMASPLINFQSNAMAIEKTIEALCEKVKAETFSFLFTGKVDAEQTAMKFGDPNDPDKDPPIHKKKLSKAEQLRVDKEAEKAEEEAANANAMQ